jgi:hypothetical protein
MRQEEEGLTSLSSKIKANDHRGMVVGFFTTNHTLIYKYSLAVVYIVQVLD